MRAVICLLFVAGAFFFPASILASVFLDDTSAAVDVRQPLSCGEASAAVMAVAMQRPWPGDVLDRRPHNSRDDMSLLEVQDLLGTIGLETDVVHCTLNDLKNVPVPFIAHWFLDPDKSEGHYVCCVPSSSSWKVFDPRCELPGDTDFANDSRFAEYFSGYALIPIGKRRYLASAERGVLLCLVGVICGVVFLSRRLRFHAASILLVFVVGCHELSGIDTARSVERNSQDAEETVLSFGSDAPAEKEAEEGRRLRVVEGPFLDLGTVSYSREVDFRFFVENCSDDPVHLSELNNEIPCCFRGKVAASAAILQPGGRGEINVSFYNGPRGGNVRAELHFAAEQPDGSLPVSIDLQFGYHVIGEPPVLSFDINKVVFPIQDLGSRKSAEFAHEKFAVQVSKSVYASEKLELSAVMGDEKVKVVIGTAIDGIANTGTPIWTIPVEIVASRESLPIGECKGFVSAKLGDLEARCPIEAYVGRYVRVIPEQRLVVVSKNGRLLNDRFDVLALSGEKVESGKVLLRATHDAVDLVKVETDMGFAVHVSVDQQSQKDLPKLVDVFFDVTGEDGQVFSVKREVSFIIL